MGSSNDLAAQWLRDGAPGGAVIVADEQRAGRGRRGRTWYTPPGVALALSVILKPPPAHAARASMIGALAIAELCDYVGIADVGIKYPNDVQINGLKVSGVLPEAIWDDDQLKGVVLGMGVNVRVQFDDDAELADKATSMEIALGKALDRVQLIAFVLQRVDYWAGRIGGAELFERWQNRLTTLGRQVSIGDVVGIAQRIEPDGALIVQQADGTETRILAGDVLIS